VLVTHSTIYVLILAIYMEAFLTFSLTATRIND